MIQGRTELAVTMPNNSYVFLLITAKLQWNVFIYHRNSLLNNLAKHTVKKYKMFLNVENII